MQQPSNRWKRLRDAALDRAQRNAFEPFSLLYPTYLVACAIYLSGFLYLSFVSQGGELSFARAAVILLVAIAGATIPLLTGSVVTLHLVSQRMRRLMGDSV